MRARTANILLTMALVSLAAVPAVMLALVLILSGCGALSVPVTRSDDSYTIRCGVERCDPRYWECSTGKPVRCSAKFTGVSRDAGRE